MKKMSLIICVLCFLPMTAFAEEHPMEITTTIPPTYTLTIPTTQEVTVNVEKTVLPDLKVSGDLAPNQIVRVSAKTEAMINTDNTQAPKLPFALTNESNQVWQEEIWTAQEVADQKKAKLNLAIKKDDWAKAKPGRYEGKIVFTSTIEANE